MDEAYVDAVHHATCSRVVAHLVDLEARTGRRVKLALEPEPACYLETTERDRRLLPRAGARRRRGARAGPLAGVPLSEAEGLLRRHLGVVFDIGHQSVGFEDIARLAGQLVDAGIPIFKLQEAAALWVEELTVELVPAAARFTDTIYLSQTTMRRDGED